MSSYLTLILVAFMLNACNNTTSAWPQGTEWKWGHNYIDRIEKTVKRSKDIKNKTKEENIEVINSTDLDKKLEEIQNEVRELKQRQINPGK